MTEQTDIQPVEDWADTPLQNGRCQITLTMTVQADTVGEGMNTAAISLARFGMDSFYLMVEDLDSGQRWIVHNGEAGDADEEAARLAQMMADGKPDGQ